MKCMVACFTTTVFQLLTNQYQYHHHHHSVCFEGKELVKRKRKENLQYFIYSQRPERKLDAKCYSRVTPPSKVRGSFYHINSQWMKGKGGRNPMTFSLSLRREIENLVLQPRREGVAGRLGARVVFGLDAAASQACRVGNLLIGAKLRFTHRAYHV